VSLETFDDGRTLGALDVGAVLVIFRLVVTTGLAEEACGRVCWEDDGLYGTLND
jgi:hypothetical protein